MSSPSFPDLPEGDDDDGLVLVIEEAPTPPEEAQNVERNEGGGVEEDEGADSGGSYDIVIEGEIDADEDDTEEVEEEKVVIPSLVEDDDEVKNISEVSGLLKLWEERVQALQSSPDGPYNPVSILTRLSEIIEFETIAYLKMDPDPFDDRHPSRTHPDCALGHSLKTLFKKEVFMNKLVHDYLRENWGENLDLAVNTTACRLFVNILPGLETAVVYQETEGLIPKLFTWAETGPEPLKSYSLGLLGASMEIPEIAGKYREKNVHLVQLMLRRLRDLQNEFFNTHHRLSTSSRPFAQFSNQLKSVPESPFGESEPSTPVKTINEHVESKDLSQLNARAEAEVNSKLMNGDEIEMSMTDSGVVSSPPAPVKLHRPPSFHDMKAGTGGIEEPLNGLQTPKAPSALGLNTPPVIVTPSRSAKKSRISLTPGNKHFLEPTAQNRTKRRKMAEEPELEECSSTSSSWAELEPNIIGQWQVFPVNLVTRQIFTLRYLSPLGEYQEMLGYAFEHNAIQIILRYLSKSHQTKETSRLTFEALKYLGALLCHKKFALEFLQAGGLQKLLQIPRPSLSATGVALCLYYIAYTEDTMEKVCLMSKNTLQNLVSYVLWLLECSHNSGRNHAIMFFGVIYPFKMMLDIFDGQDGLRAILNVITTQPPFVKMRRRVGGLPPSDPSAQELLGEDDVDEALSDEDLMISKQAIRQVSVNLKRYFECHLGFTADKLRRTIGKNQNHPFAPGPILPPYKALKPFSSTELANLHSTVLNLLPENAQRWAPVDRFVNQSGLDTIMRTVAMTLESYPVAGRGETIRNFLDVLAICCLVPKTQVLLTERFKINSTSEFTGLSCVLMALDGELINEPDVKKSALQVIGNCVCGPIHHKKPSSDIQIKLWEFTRINNGILILTRLLQTKTPITDADSIRALACWCLSGLSRYKQVRQVLQQLPLIRSGMIQNLMTEPILQDKRHDHAMFQKYAMEIVKLVHGKEDNFALDLGDLIRKSDLISQSKIDYHEKDLTELIHDHLIKAGLNETAALLQMEYKSKHDYALSNSAATSPISLDKIVRQYLLNQHGLCKTPMVTCPTFDLLKPHKCPSKSDRPRVTDFRTLGTNFGSRFLKRQLGGCTRGHEDRKLIYSRYKPFRVIRSEEEDNGFTACAFSPCCQWTYIGTSNGEIKLYNTTNWTEEGNYQCHDHEIYNIQPNGSGSLLLTSNIWREPYSSLCKMDGVFEKVMEFYHDEYVEFSKLNQDKVVATHNDTATIYDVETKKKILTLTPRMSNQYVKNRATFDPYDELILSDGVLWDFKSGKEIHKFDKLNENLNGVFNPKSGLEIISNTEIWDVRTFHLLKTVRQLDQCMLTFTNDGSIIYGVKIEREQQNSDGNITFRHADTSFVVIDNLDDYSSIATIELKRHILSMSTNPNDLQIALVEHHTTADDDLSPDSCVRIYEVGRTRAEDMSNANGADAEDDDDVQSDDEDEVENDEDDDSDDGDDDDGSNDDDDEETYADNDLDRILDQILDPAGSFLNNGDNDEGGSSSSWDVDDDVESSDDSEDSDSD